MKAIILIKLAVALSLFPCVNLRAQNRQSSPIVAESSSCNREAALELIQQQLAESKTLDDNARRITVVIKAAELLWPYQREKARAAFVEAWDLAIQHFKDKGDKPVREGLGLMIGTPDMRYTVITAVARHDFDWAKKLTEQLLQEQENDAKEKGLTEAA